MSVFQIVKSESKSEGCCGLSKGRKRESLSLIAGAACRSESGPGALFHMGICSNLARLCYTSLNISFRGPSPGAAGAAG